MKKKKYLRYGKMIYKIILGCILINSTFLISLAVAEEYKSQIRSENFKEVYFEGDTKYEDIDSYNNQLNLFFGIDYTVQKKSFSDLEFPLTSKNIRILYNEKNFSNHFTFNSNTIILNFYINIIFICINIYFNNWIWYFFYKHSEDQNI